MNDPPEPIYTDGFDRISREEFEALQDRLCRGDPVAWVQVTIQEHRKHLAMRSGCDND